ncbi:MAG: nuclear transport factor 2 family protein [Bryobacteraceae bacterium]|jgi:ketosteroid isomerase-like protein
MPAEENKAIARRFLQAWRAGGQGIVEELAAPDITVSYSHFPQPFRGAQAFRELLAQTIGCFPDLQDRG